MPGKGAAVTQQDHTRARARARTTVHARACALTHTHTHTCHDSAPFSRRLRYAARTRELAAGPEESSPDAADAGSDARARWRFWRLGCSRRRTRRAGGRKRGSCGGRGVCTTCPLRLAYPPRRSPVPVLSPPLRISRTGRTTAARTHAIPPPNTLSGVPWRWRRLRCGSASESTLAFLAVGGQRRP